EIVANLRILLEHGRRGVMAGKIGQRHTLMAQSSQPLGEGAVVSDNHAAFTSGHHLARVQAEDRYLREPAHRPVAVAAAEGAGGIVDDADAVSRGNLVDGIDVTR